MTKLLLAFHAVDFHVAGSALAEDAKKAPAAAKPPSRSLSS